VIFVDTSALVALVEPDDRFHERAARYAASIRPDEVTTHSYVALEATSLVQNRLGDRAARDLLRSWLTVLAVRWVTREVHEAAVAALLASSRRQVSLVDFVSFEVMRRLGIRTAFSFDKDFQRAGFRTVP
jgi:predicted nucleic acid-binding protein